MLPLKWHRRCDEKLPCASGPRESSQVSVFIMWGYPSQAHSICQQCWDYADDQWMNSLPLTHILPAGSKA